MQGIDSKKIISAGRMRTGVAAILLCVLAGCAASGPQAKQPSPEERHRAAVYDMMLVSPVPDVFFSGVRAGFNSKSPSAHATKVFSCAMKKMPKSYIARVYADAGMPLFTEDEARKLSAYMQSDAGKRGGAQLLLPKEQQHIDNDYWNQTLPFWTKLSAIMKNGQAKAVLHAKMTQNIQACTDTMKK